MTKKISIDIPDDIYGKIKAIALHETIHQGKFVGMKDIILPVLKKTFSKKY